MQLIITPQGTIRCLYTDELELSRLGPVELTRASHVEPTQDGLWTVDLAPVRGPVLGPYRWRRQALAAEVEWLQRHWLPWAY